MYCTCKYIRTVSTVSASFGLVLQNIWLIRVIRALKSAVDPGSVMCAGAFSVQKLIRKIYIRTRVSTLPPTLLPSPPLLSPRLLTRYLGGRPIYTRILFRDSRKDKAGNQNNLFIPSSRSIAPVIVEKITNLVIVGKRIQKSYLDNKNVYSS